MKPRGIGQPDAEAAAWGLGDAAAVLVGALIVGLSFAAEGSIRWGGVVLGLVWLVAAGAMNLSHRERREARPGEYWWTGLAVPFGFGTWACFLYLAFRLRSALFALAGVGNGAALAAALTLNSAGGDEGTESDISGAILFATWVCGAIHGKVINASVRRRFDDAADPAP